ncbi:50S ribosomal protein L11 methyltransferase [Apilactobacillus apinorum]|uniref:50S ribosomal protein L11 methyltransferase n=1 Tax=Apilactobacillus apinorum TaxID=1218495 RepID=UPI0006B4167F|nr:50S ribosomal protein L11 methyltransferase [Apilactobacillus apinorum]KOY68944.1 Ribosomal protein L11 methyltransferase [Apilactobacillus apinorum]CAI2676866.1 prmA Ribosomal protein L11 methyltransferase [Apilactobacillus apinorum]
MEWTEISVLTNDESQDAVINILMEFGSLGVELDTIDKDTLSINSYFPEDFDIESKVPAIQSRVSQLSEFGLNPGKAEVITKNLNDDKWNSEWEKYYHAKRITKFLTISPVWENYIKEFDGELVIKLDPKKAFGTGVHPTTVLCLQAIESVIRENESILDVGTGSGVLSIAAKLLGAGEISAYDYDDDAVDSAKKNVALNGFENDIFVDKNSLLDGISKKADIILANMLPEAVLPLIPQSINNINEGGKIIISGIIKDKLTVTLETLENNQYVVDQVSTLGDWRGIIAHLRRDDE